MNLYETPPEYIVINGQKYNIDTDFRTWIKFQNILLSEKSNDEKTADLLAFVASLGLPFLEETLKAITVFFAGGEKKHKSEKNKQPMYNFETDSPLIFSAFLTQYRIDVSSEKMHWWKFKELFSTLSSEHIISEVIWARGANTSDMDANTKKRVQTLRKAYPLHTTKKHKMTAEERLRGWKEYAERRYKEVESNLPILRSEEFTSDD